MAAGDTACSANAASDTFTPGTTAGTPPQGNGQVRLQRATRGEAETTSLPECGSVERGSCRALTRDRLLLCGRRQQGENGTIEVARRDGGRLRIP